MRLIAIKVYRAFPELDQFPDDRCEEYVRLAQRRRWFTGMLIVPIIALVVVLGGFACSGLLVAGVVERNWPTSSGFTVFAGIAVLMSFTFSSSVGLLIRDLWLRWAVRGQLAAARCPSCRYLLLGLPVVDGTVTCPECGRVLELAKQGWTPADLLVQPTV